MQVGRWIMESSTSRQCQFASKGTQMPTGPVTRSTDDQPPGSCPLSIVKLYPSAARSNQQSYCRAPRPNTGAQSSPHVKAYGLKGFFGRFHSRSKLPILRQPQQRTYCSQPSLSRSGKAHRGALSLHPRMCYGQRCRLATHQHESSDNRHLY